MYYLSWVAAPGYLNLQVNASEDSPMLKVRQRKWRAIVILLVLVSWLVSFSMASMGCGGRFGICWLYDPWLSHSGSQKVEIGCKMQRACRVLMLYGRRSSEAPPLCQTPVLYDVRSTYPACA